MNENIKWWQTLNEVLDGVQKTDPRVWTHSSPDLRRGLQLTNNTLESIKVYDEGKNYEVIYYLVYCEVAHAYTLSEDMDGCFDDDLHCMVMVLKKRLPYEKRFDSLQTNKYLEIMEKYKLPKNAVTNHSLNQENKKDDKVKENKITIQEWEEKLKQWKERDRKRKEQSKKLHIQYIKKYDDLFFLDDNKTWYDMLCEFKSCQHTFNPDAPIRWNYGQLRDNRLLNLDVYDEERDYRKIFISIYKECDMNRTGPDREWIKCEENPYFIDATNKLRELLERHGMNVPYYEDYFDAYNPENETQPEEPIIPLEPRPVFLIQTKVLSDEEEKTMMQK